MKKIKTKKDKYAFGGSVDPLQSLMALKAQRQSETPGRIENPNEALTRNSISEARAMQTANSNGFTQLLDVLGGMAQGVGSTLMTSGIDTSGASSLTQFLGKNGDSLSGGLGLLSAFTGGKTMFAEGGVVAPKNIEVEGKEVYETPLGQVGEFFGPSHEQGGIDLAVKPGGVAANGAVPEGTYVYPKRLKIGGKSLAERKKARDNKESKLEDLLEDSSDIALKNSLKRTKESNELEDYLDRSYQEMKANKGKKEKFDGGGYIEKLAPWLQQIQGMELPLPVGEKTQFFDPTKVTVPTLPQPLSTPAVNKSGRSSGKINSAGLPTAGDALGIYGNLFQAFAPMNNTIAQRAGDTPNINPYENFGKEALNTIEGQKGLVQGIFDNEQNKINANRQGAMARNANSARGINTQRALNLTTDAQVGEMEGQMFANQLQAMLGISDKKANTELTVSGKKAEGLQYKDEADRRDRDAFYSQMAKDLAAVGEGLSRTGKSVNDIKARGAKSTMLNDLFDYIGIDPMTGQSYQKDDAVMPTGRGVQQQISDVLSSDLFQKGSKAEKESIMKTILGDGAINFLNNLTK